MEYINKIVWGLVTGCTTIALVWCIDAAYNRTETTFWRVILVISIGLVINYILQTINKDDN